MDKVKGVIKDWRESRMKGIEDRRKRSKTGNYVTDGGLKKFVFICDQFSLRLCRNEPTLRNC